MKRLFLLSLTAAAVATSAASTSGQTSVSEEILREEFELCRREAERRLDSIRAFERAADLKIDTVVADQFSQRTFFPAMPLVYNGFRRLYPVEIKGPVYVFRMRSSSREDDDRYAGILYSVPTHIDDLEEGDEFLSIAESDTLVTIPRHLALNPGEIVEETIPQAQWEAWLEPWTYSTPQWLEVAARRQQMEDDFKYLYMVQNPSAIDYLYWQLPKQPKLKDDKMTYSEYILSQFLPPVDTSEAVLPETEQRRVYWLHTVGGGIQFSQAYISSNWYQGGNNHLSLLFNFNWDVALNTVYKPNLMFTSSLQYKLAVNSNPKEALHRYSISQDLLQYNLKTGVKAFNKWFYSYNLQFKTQIFNSFPVDSPNLGAAFLSPADMNMGLGMTYASDALKGRMKISASISPISYNLKVCTSDKIDHTQFNILPDRHTRSEIGSNAEVTMVWDITPNINWKSRLFLFSDYHYFQADWENTFTFNINRFLSTQLYVHPRYDSSAVFGGSKWHYWQLKEILSFGLSYTFTTAP